MGFKRRPRPADLDRDRILRDAVRDIAARCRHARSAAGILAQRGPSVKRTYRTVERHGVVACATAAGEIVALPVFAGILKHPDPDQLVELLADPAVARQYTCEALRKAHWNLLRQFPRAWLMECLPRARLPAGRRRALALLLGAGRPADRRLMG